MAAIQLTNEKTEEKMQSYLSQHNIEDEIANNETKIYNELLSYSNRDCHVGYFLIDEGISTENHLSTFSLSDMEKNWASY